MSVQKPAGPSGRVRRPLSATSVTKLDSGHDFSSPVSYESCTSSAGPSSIAARKDLLACLFARLLRMKRSAWKMSRRYGKTAETNKRFQTDCNCICEQQIRYRSHGSDRTSCIPDHAAVEPNETSFPVHRKSVNAPSTADRHQAAT